MFCWNAWWSTIFCLTVRPEDLLNASITAWYAFFGTASDPLEPRVTTLELLPLLLPPPQAANSGAAAASPATPPIPFSSARRLSMGAPTRLGNGDRGTEGPGISSPPRGPAASAARRHRTQRD